MATAAAPAASAAQPSVRWGARSADVASRHGIASSGWRGARRRVPRACARVPPARRSDRRAVRASSPHADAIAPLRASARTAWRSVGQCSKPRAAAATARAVTPRPAAPSASSDAAVPAPATGCSAQPHGPDHSTTRRPVALALATATSPAPRPARRAARGRSPAPSAPSTARAPRRPRRGRRAGPRRPRARPRGPRRSRVPPRPGPTSATPATTAAAPAPAARPRANGRAASTPRRSGAPSRNGTSGAAKTTGPCHVPQRATATRPTSATAGPHSATVVGRQHRAEGRLAVP